MRAFCFILLIWSLPNSFSLLQLYSQRDQYREKHDMVDLQSPCQFYAVKMKMCPPGLSNPSTSPRVGTPRGERRSVIHEVPTGDFPTEDGGRPAKWIQTVFISQNHVSPLRGAAQSQTFLICRIDWHGSQPAFGTHMAATRPPSQQKCLTARCAPCCIFKSEPKTRGDYDKWAESRQKIKK